MKKNFIFSVLMLMSGLVASAQNVSVEDVTIKTYETASVNIVLKGAASYTAMGFTLELPTGFMVASEMNNGEMNYMINANSDFIDDHTVVSKMKSSNNVMRVAVFSENNKPFKSNDDTVLTIMVKTRGEKGTFHAKIKSLELANSSNHLVSLPDVSFSFIVDGMLGDVNDDGMISISDVTAQVNIILELENETTPIYNHTAADMNLDGAVTVVDVTKLVDNILKGNSVPPPTPGLCPDDYHPHVIDLGLPSGTKWACCNVGAQSQEETGCYFAWGETTGSYNGKSCFDWEHYKYNHFDSNVDNSYFGYSLTKYCNDSEYGYNGYTDNLTTLQSIDDAATTYWGNQWRTPTKTEMAELLNVNNTIWTVDTINGVTGILVNSIIEGYTDKSIFLPLTGMFDGKTVDDFGEYAEYWSSSLYNRITNDASILHIDNAGKKNTGIRERDTGLTIRPVFIDSPVLNSLSLSLGSVEVTASQETTVEITSGSGSYNVSSSDENVATVLITGNTVKITGVSGGTANIIVTDTQTGETANIEVTVTGAGSASSLCPDDNHPHMIDLGLPSGTKWACCNVDANAPEDYGGYYAWGETMEKDEYTWSNYIHCDGSSDTSHDLGDDIAGTQYDVAHVKWGGSWMMPTSVQLDELHNNCTYTWTTINGVCGGLFTSTNGCKVFLPAAGCRWYKITDGSSTYGNYWSSSVSSSLSWDLYFNSSRVRRDGDQRAFGYSVRPVAIENNLIPLHLSASNILVNVGDSIYFVRITSGNGSYTVSSSDESVVTVMIYGNSVKVSVTGAGTATITVTDTMTKETATIKVTVMSPLCPDGNHPHMIDLGLPSGTKWACCNVDATTPEEYGGYYARGEIEEKDVYNGSTYIYYDGDTFYDIGYDISGTEYDVAHVKWGDSWVMPTREQLEELCNSCSYIWTSVNGINGGKFIGPNGGTIFLPAAGERSDDGITDTDTYGLFWSSTNHKMLRAYNLSIDSLGGSYGSKQIYHGLTVRPVSQ